MPQKFENQCSIDDIKAITDGQIVIYQASEHVGQRVEKSVDEIYELIITCKSASTFPDEIGKLENLQKLTIGGGDFNQISLEIGKLKKLELLILLNTRLEKLPLELYRIPSLKRMALMYNINEFEFQEDLCGEDFELEISYTSTKINKLPKCLEQNGKIKLLNKEAY